MIYNNGALQICQSQNQTIPPEGPKSIPLILDFSQVPSYDVDLSTLANNNQFTITQCLFIDNADNPNALVVVMGKGNGQRIVAKGNSQGYYPVLSANPASLNFSSAVGSPLINVQILNVPISGCVWSTI